MEGFLACESPVPLHLWNFKLSLTISYKNFVNRDFIPSEFPVTTFDGVGVDIIWKKVVASYLPT